MVELRICNECGNVYGRFAGMKPIIVCPLCHLGHYKKVEID